MDNIELDELTRAAELMDRIGGGFASSIAQAFYRADASNRARLVAAFPHLFDRYRDMARADVERAE
jgi:hypothetical protein